MTPGGRLPVEYNSEIGYAIHLLQRTTGMVMTGPRVLDILEARGRVHTRDEARAVLRQARANIAATERAQGATGAQSLRAACNYDCPDDTMIGVRVRVNAVRPDGTAVDNVSIVVQARASENMADVLHRARTIFNRLYRRGTAHRSGELRMTSDPTPGDIDQILLNYTEGR